MPFAIPAFYEFKDQSTTIDPWYYIFLEAEQDLESSILLLIMGLYKCSLVSLRSYLELNIFTLSNFINKDNDSFQAWLNGKRYTPNIKDLLTELIKRSDKFKILDEQLNWKNEVTSLYEELSKFAHTRGYHHSNRALRNSNKTSYDDGGMEKSAKLLLKTIRVSAMGFIINFPMSLHPVPLFKKFAFDPPSNGFLDANQVEEIKAIFPDDVAERLSEICSKDEYSNLLSKSILSMPDQTEEEIFKSLKRTLESDAFKNSKDYILQMIKDDKHDLAIDLVISSQRALIKSIMHFYTYPFDEVRRRD